MDRNPQSNTMKLIPGAVALRKESVDRNLLCGPCARQLQNVALRKESVDRNSIGLASIRVCTTSLSARRAWIEMHAPPQKHKTNTVALRKESVDRNITVLAARLMYNWSLSARRAWIEIRLVLL